jgi:hypothetical protein
MGWKRKDMTIWAPAWVPFPHDDKSAILPSNVLFSIAVVEFQSFTSTCAI